jgi:hypothetical protein
MHLSPTSMVATTAFGLGVLLANMARAEAVCPDAVPAAHGQPASAAQTSSGARDASPVLIGEARAQDAR